MMIRSQASTKVYPKGTARFLYCLVLAKDNDTTTLAMLLGFLKPARESTRFH